MKKIEVRASDLTFSTYIFIYIYKEVFFIFFSKYENSSSRGTHLLVFKSAPLSKRYDAILRSAKANHVEEVKVVSLQKTIRGSV